MEPNSNLGKALRYWRRHGNQLTPWQSEGEAPLSSKLAEEALRKEAVLKLDGKKSPVRMIGPPAEATFSEAAGDVPVTTTIVTEEFESSAAAVTEDKEGTGERLLSHLMLAAGDEPSRHCGNQLAVRQSG